MKANKNRSIAYRLLKYATVVATIVLSALLLFQVVAAATDVQIGPFFVQLLLPPQFNTAANLSTWTYRVTVSTTQEINALSHVSLGLDPKCVVVDATSDGSYSIEYNTQETRSDTFSGRVTKWTPSGEGMSTNGQTSLFTLTVANATPNRVATDSTYFALKYGNNLSEDWIDGPECETTAVSLSSLSANANRTSQIVTLGLALATVTAVSTALDRAMKKQS